MSLRIVVADSSAVDRRLVKQALAGVDALEIAGSAPTAAAVLQRMQCNPPDILTLDLDMPDLSGTALLEELRLVTSVTPLIVMTRDSDAAARLRQRAGELGILDIIVKPEGASAEQTILLLRDRLTRLLAPAIQKLAHGCSAPALPAHCTDDKAPSELERMAGRMIRLAARVKPAVVLIGVSTGGPDALARLVPRLPADLNLPVLIVQHMPPLFTRNLADSLNGASVLRVKEAEDGEIARIGTVYVAPGGRQMKIAAATSGRIEVHITSDPAENNCRPAVDYLFRSAAEAFPGRSIAVLLTGMGRDGTQGLRCLKQSGCVSIAQDEASSVVFGMAKEAIHAGLIDIVAPLEEIPAEIVRASSVVGARA